MRKTIRYISISHETATVWQREKFYIPETEKGELATDICREFPDIEGLLLLVTCNRVEVYFESSNTRASAMCRFIMNRQRKADGMDGAHLFRKCDSTQSTLLHLLRVSSGLSSQVLGDTEIVHQIKKAYLFSLEHKLQGSLLERAIQTVFKTHKRISNETEFRDGTTSVAYKSLKVVSDIYKGNHPGSKKILLIGTGDIVRQLLKYNSKFNFINLYISNRTRENAVQLAVKHNCQLFEWENVLQNNFVDFDVIISAAANCRHLIREMYPDNKERLLIDLALPGNIKSSLGERDHLHFYDLDTISNELEETKDRRVAAIEKVNGILEEELLGYMEWYREAPLREFLGEFKITLVRQVEDYYEKQSVSYDASTISKVADRVMRKLMKQTQVNISSEKLETLIEQNTLFD